MTLIVSLLILLGILSLVTAVITAPFWKEGYGSATRKRDADDPNAEYTRLLGSLRDLDLDFQEGKIAEGDYDLRRNLIKGQAAACLEKGIQEDHSPAPDSAQEN
ncbi:MAG: hypothetical protein NTZ74_14695 [Chloroflexi bacterium]|nr:hypothetical protein [Chloroflexota bacterium]